MSYEQYGNLGATTVGVGGYTAGSGVLNVISTTGSPAFSNAAPFRVTVEDPVTFQVYVILKVTGINSSTQFAVTAESADANATAGNNVFQTLTQGSLLQLIADVHSYGPYSSLPSTVPPAGYRYKCTDSPYEFISTGSLWQAFYRGFPATLPPAATNWTTEGLGTYGALSNAQGSLKFIADYGTGQQSITSAYIAAPGSTPYSFVARFFIDSTGFLYSTIRGSYALTTIGGFYMGFRDSAGKYVLINVLGYSGGGNAYVLTQSMSSYSTVASTFNGVNGIQVQQILGSLADWWFKIRNDGTNIYFEMSIDGQDWYIIYQSTITNYLANANYVSWGCQQDGGSPIVKLYDWTQGT